MAKIPGMGAPEKSTSAEITLFLGLASYPHYNGNSGSNKSVDDLFEFF
jgi:hypothetical protein